MDSKDCQVFSNWVLTFLDSGVYYNCSKETKSYESTQQLPNKERLGSRCDESGGVVANTRPYSPGRKRAS